MLELRVDRQPQNFGLGYDGLLAIKVAIELNSIVHEDKELVAEECTDLLTARTVVLVVALDELYGQKTSFVRIVVPIDVHVLWIDACKLLLIGPDFSETIWV